MLWLISWWNGWIILVTVAHSENRDCELHWQFLKRMKWGRLLYVAWDDGWYEIICACHLISLFQPKALISHHRAMISIHWPKGSGARFAANVQSASERDVMVPGRQKICRPATWWERLIWTVGLTKGRVELLKGQVTIVVVIVVTQEVLHGALQ